VKLRYYLKVEFITGQNKSLDSNVITDNYHEYHTSPNEINVNYFECQIPIHIFGSANGGTLCNRFGVPHSFALKKKKKKKKKKNLKNLFGIDWLVALLRLV
jgi:hypothetical protein